MGMGSWGSEERLRRSWVNCYKKKRKKRKKRTIEKGKPDGGGGSMF